MEINGNALGHTLISGLIFVTFWFQDFSMEDIGDFLFALMIVFMIGFWFINSTSRLFQKGTAEVLK